MQKTIAYGVFGAPTMRIARTVFRARDQLDFVREALIACLLPRHPFQQRDLP